MVNPLLADVDNRLPGITVALPSMGIFYDNTVLKPNAKVDDITVNTFSMIDEIKYRDPLLQASGNAVHDIITRICPEILAPEKMCDVDIEAILIAARIASFGNSMTMNHVCENPDTYEEIDPSTQQHTGNVFPVCRNEIERELNLEDLIQQYTPIDLSNIYVDLEEFGQRAYIKPISHTTALGMTKLMIKRSRDLNEFNQKDAEVAILSDDDVMYRYNQLIDMTYQLSSDILLDSIWYVVTKSGLKVDDREIIAEWLEKIPNKKQITAKISELTDMLKKMSQIEYVCESCGFINHVPIVLDADKLFLSESAASTVLKKSTSTSDQNAPARTKRSRTLPRSPITTTEQ